MLTSVKKNLPDVSVNSCVTFAQVDDDFNFFSKLTLIFLAPEPVTFTNRPRNDIFGVTNTPPKFVNDNV